MIFASLWELLLVLRIVNPDFVPSVLPIVADTATNLRDGPLREAVGITLSASALGLAIAIVFGVSIGLMMGLSRWLNAALSPVVEFMRPMPSVALVPVAILIFGLGFRMTVALVVFAATWPILYNTLYGLTHLEPLLLDTARALGLTSSRIVARVMVPAALPSILTGVRVSASTALILAITAEIIGGAGRGIGFYIISASFAGDFVRAFSGVFMAGLLGYLINFLLHVVDRHIVAWSFGYHQQEK